MSNLLWIESFLHNSKIQVLVISFIKRGALFVSNKLKLFVSYKE
jgi:fructose-1-phosphate kinase PfkB-like protein